MKITKPGKTPPERYEGTCRVCLCEFAANETETTGEYRGKDGAYRSFRAECPSCGHGVWMHVISPWPPMSPPD